MLMPCCEDLSKISILSNAPLCVTPTTHRRSNKDKRERSNQAIARVRGSLAVGHGEESQGAGDEEWLRDAKSHHAHSRQSNAENFPFKDAEGRDKEAWLFARRYGYDVVSRGFPK